MGPFFAGGTHLRVLERKYLKEKSDETTAVGAPLRHPAFQRLWLGLSISYLRDQSRLVAIQQTTGHHPGDDAGEVEAEDDEAHRRTVPVNCNTNLLAGVDIPIPMPGLRQN